MTNLWRGVTLAILTMMGYCSLLGQNRGAVTVSDVYTDKTRYTPNEEVHLFIVLRNNEPNRGVSHLTSRARPCRFRHKHLKLLTGQPAVPAAL